MEIQLALTRKRFLLDFDGIVDDYIKVICRSNIRGIVIKKHYHQETINLLIHAEIFFYCSLTEWERIYELLKKIYLFPKIKMIKPQAKNENKNGICRLSLSDINRNLYTGQLLTAVPRTVVRRHCENSDGDD